MVEAKLLRKKLKNGLIVDKWDLVTIIEKQQAEIASLQKNLDVALMIVNEPAKTLTDEEIIKTMVQFDVYSADDQCLIEAGRAILRKAQEK
jgi:hypothetical protein